MTKFKKCETTYCDRTATKHMKVYLQEDEDRLGGWKKDDHPDNIFEVGRGWAVAKDRKFFKLNVCKVCYEVATVDDFEIQHKSGAIRPISRVERV